MGNHMGEMGKGGDDVGGPQALMSICLLSGLSPIEPCYFFAAFIVVDINLLIGG
jgi:hypothetical protein